MRESLAFSLGSARTELIFTDEPYRPETAPERLYVFDKNTASLFQALPEASLVLEPGEGTKAWEGVATILAAAFGRGLARDSLFVGVGGGMICDLTAFAASVYMRGARLELVPTTLLAMVDASFGGKTAINFQGLKNMVGTFFPAERVVLSAAFLGSLPEREFRSGLAEVVKSALLGDAELLGLLEKSFIGQGGKAGLPDAKTLAEMVKRSLLIKARFVVEDPTEKGVRAFLNLGHTFGHGLEAATRFSRFTHGEAVAWGIFRALEAGLGLGVTDPAYADRARVLLRALGYPEKAEGLAPAAVLEAMTRDKKKKGGKVRFVLQRNLGESFLSPLEDGLLARVIRSGLA